MASHFGAFGNAKLKINFFFAAGKGEGEKENTCVKKMAFVTFKGLALYRENNCLNARTKWRN